MVLDIKVGITRLTGNDGTEFVHPGYGIEEHFTCDKIMDIIDVAGLKKPTFRDNVVLAYYAWQNPEEDFSKEIINLMKSSQWLAADTAMLYVKDEGVYIQDHPQRDEQGQVIMDKDTILARLNMGDSTIRFVEFGYAIDDIEDWSEHEFVGALCGDKTTAKLLSEMTQNYSERSKLDILNNEHLKTSSEKVAIASLETSEHFDRLEVGGFHNNNFQSDGFAYGIVK
jgi:hypothetical protein